MELCDLLKEERKRLNLTQEEMATGIVSKSFYSRVEKGRSRISAIDLVAMLKCHKIDINQFFSKMSVTSESEEHSEAEIINQIRLCFYGNDLSELQKIKEKYAGNSNMLVKVYLQLAEVALTKDTSKIDETTSEFIKKEIFNGENWNIYTLKIFLNSMYIYHVEDLAQIVKTLIQKFHDIKKTEYLALIAGICINFLDLSYKADYAILREECFSYLDRLPSNPEFFMQKLIGKYYCFLIQKDAKNLEKILDILQINGYGNYSNLLPTI